MAAMMCKASAMTLSRSGRADSGLASPWPAIGQSLRQIKRTDPPCGWGMMDALNTLIAPDLTP